MKVLSVVNNKGGTGKTTTAINIASGLSETSKVLLISLDTQINTNYTSTGTNTQYSVYDVLVNKCSIQDSIINTSLGYDYISSSNDLIYFEQLQTPNKLSLLKAKLEPLNSIYNYVVLDTPPQLNTALLSAIYCSDSIIITCESDLYSLQGLTELVENIRAIETAKNKQFENIKVLINRFSSRTVYAKELLEDIKTQAKALGIEVFNSTIRESTKIKESNYLKMSIFQYAKSSPVTEDYRNLIKEIIE